MLLIILLIGFTVACDPKCEICLQDKCKKCKSPYELAQDECVNSKAFQAFVDRVTAELSSEQKEMFLSPERTQSSPLLNVEIVNQKFTDTRSLYKMLNDYLVDYSVYARTLQEMERGFETKTFFKIENIKNSILDVLEASNIDSTLKSQAISESLKEIDALISSEFTKITKKVDSFEVASTKRINKLKESTLNSLKTTE